MPRGRSFGRRGQVEPGPCGTKLLRAWREVWVRPKRPLWWNPACGDDDAPLVELGLWHWHNKLSVKLIPGVLALCLSTGGLLSSIAQIPVALFDLSY
ncbi:hypothetical protein PGT21_022699 [Puccinia graminis f. sp. tritici]|uniref:Uncharacterized protein n=1 Tax=Puccinia graminis f. sp. tritici TaxID=56615 RepID=A0A5B0N368_PUCGR|nr:hypothetical protein PGT21_022699 [Puccinia graminis f. sp. tritici]